MSKQSENKKLDFSSLPRGAIGLRGLPVSRNTRLPSIRSPRDLTLGTVPKRTFMPNIPVRREKKSEPTPNVPQVKQEHIKTEGKTPVVSDRGRGRGRGNKTIIQTQGSIFSDGIAADVSRKERRARDSFQVPNSSTTRGVTVKKEVEDKDIARVNSKLDRLFKDDFIDDGDDDYENSMMKPVVFPPIASVKNEAKAEVKEPVVNFDPDIAKEMDFDVNRVAKFIKKEKGTENEPEVKPVEVPQQSSSEINKLLNIDSNFSKLVLLKLPQFLNLGQKMDEAESPQKQSDNKTPENQNMTLSSIRCLPEGNIGKLQILKSGKTKLLIGPVEYTLDSYSSMSSSKHELVSITTNSNTGDLCTLGCITDMLNFTANNVQLLGQ